jgi:OFA family oxalate/formate antiporter-like MFS transporter
VCNFLEPLKYYIQMEELKVNSNKKGWIVVFAGAAINLTFGILYAWSIFSKTLVEENNWSNAQASLPYTIAILMFALMMIPAGKLQDKIGPKQVVRLGGILTGTGLFLAGFLTNLPGLIFSFGILAGAGIGLGYASTTPPAVKWFPPEKKGLIAGIVVGGFGLASMYIAPLTNYLISAFGVFNSLRILGVAFFVFVLILSKFVENPDKPLPKSTNPKHNVPDLEWHQMLKTKQFYQLWFMFFAGATGGLMIIGHLSKISSIQLGGNVGFILVALAAIANALGRPIGGAISDKLGRGKTMMILYILQGLTLLFFSFYTNFASLLTGAAIVYFAYGSMLAVYPSACGDYYGTKNLGINYGILFSAWGIGGTVGPLLGGFIADKTGTYNLSFIIAAVILAIAAFLGFTLKPYVHNSSK